MKNPIQVPIPSSAAPDVQAAFRAINDILGNIQIPSSYPTAPGASGTLWVDGTTVKRA